MIIGGIKHREQRFNSRSAGVSSALLFISIGGKDGIIYQLIVTVLSSYRNVVCRCVCTYSILKDLWEPGV